ncbi:F-box only protein 7 isoform X2 [Parasteatoda tepidariorum]|nr:F-box only protein 7 isoform X2 [Parasteatoda tepidariorum]XP_042906341.1 F-box only protein 7 isoform X2 [Parasteatoda tepidariorum]XP_042906343.1 F-box only protein 7 isoform X2 [Parasteatoda tepidariorum]
MTNYSENHGILQESTFPKGFQKLLSVANVETSLDYLNVFLHACALDVGFLPKNVDEQDVYNSMPEGWKMIGVWKFQYYHKSCPEQFCWMTCISLYSFITIHGAVESGSSQNNIYVKLKTTDYLNSNSEPKAVEDFFKNTEKLEIKFKDRFCFPLLAALQENAGCAPTFGFSAAVDEVKMYILQLLPVQNVIAMSLVNKDCNRIANSPFLWKHLLIRDFGLVDDQSVSSNENYKELYKTEFVKSKRRTRMVFPPASPSFRIPSFPPSYIDVRRDLDPDLQQAFPYLRDRFRPNGFFPPYDFNWFM